MNKEKSKNQSSEPLFPEESKLVVKKILEKYGLMTEQKEGLEKMRSLETSLEERKSIFNNLPGKKIAKLVRDYAEAKISLENIPLRLEKELNVSEKDASQMFQDLKKTVLDFVEWEAVEEKEITSRVIPEPEAKEAAEKPKIPSKKDTYREPIG